MQYTLTKVQTAHDCVAIDATHINRPAARCAVLNTDAAIKTLDAFLETDHGDEDIELWLYTYPDVTLPYVEQYINQYKRNGGRAKFTICAEYKGVVKVKVHP